MNNTAVTEQTSAVLNALTREGLSDKTTAVLIGSCARGVANNRSDIDLLIVHKDERQVRIGQLGDIHLQQYSRITFLRKLAEGDDYPSCALRLGIPLHDPDGWWAKQAAMESENPHWPDWRPKVAYAKKRLKMASELLEIGDLEAASEEAMFAASHFARTILLKQGVFPLSRPELPAQLNEFEPAIAHLLANLIHSEMEAAELVQCLSLLKHRINGLTVVPVMGGRSLAKASAS